MTYTPNPSFTGHDVTVIPVNHAPSANGQSVTTNQDTAKSITLTGSDPDGDPLTFSVEDGPSHGALTGNGPSLVYHPDAGYSGPDAFEFFSNDGQRESELATVAITVVPAVVAGHAPLAQDGTVTTTGGVPVAAVLHGTDVDGDLLTFLLVTRPAHGQLVGVVHAAGRAQIAAPRRPQLASRPR